MARVDESEIPETPQNETSCGFASVMVPGFLSTFMPVLAIWPSARFSSGNKPESSRSANLLSNSAISVLFLASSTSFSASSLANSNWSWNSNCFYFISNSNNFTLVSIALVRFCSVCFSSNVALSAAIFA